MFDFLKKKMKMVSGVKKEEAEHVDSDKLEQPIWFEIGEDNPFDQRILDIRPITLNVVATTTEKWIAENFNESRADNGEQYIGSEIVDSQRFESAIRYPHNGALLEGVVFKADSMDVKWDIYAYGEWFYFVRSWTSELVYKVHYINSGNELVFDFLNVKNDLEDEDTLHVQNINSIMLTHVLGRVWPYKIPEKMRGLSEREMALYLFSQFGNKATIATFSNILSICLKNK